MIDVDAESTARGDTHICLSFTEKAIAASMSMPVVRRSSYRAYYGIKLDVILKL